MSGDESEEKTLPATSRKLKKQREKGSVVTSKETVMSLTGIVAVVYLYARRSSIAEKMEGLWIIDPANKEQTFDIIIQAKAVIVMQLAQEIVLPLIGLIGVISILSGLTVAGGPVFSFESLTPKFEKINPASGFKRIFSRKAFLTFLMHVIRLSALGSIFALILVNGYSAMMLAPVCGLGCATDTFQSVILPMVIGAVAVMFAMAVFDYLLQRAEFLREQKMTMTEFKHEMKDQMGDPHMRGHLKQERRQMIVAPTGAGQALLVISSGSKMSVGIRYVEGETPAPLVVAKTKGPEARRRMLKASNALEVHEPMLVEALGKIAVGDYVTTEELIVQLAPLIQQSLVKAQ